MIFDAKTVLSPGMHFVVKKMLTEKETAAQHGRPQLGHLIATPVYVGMMIAAATGTVEDRLPAGLVTVGRAMEFTHDVPSSLGMTMRVKATLTKIAGDRLFFDIEAWDDRGPVGHGKHERAIVIKERLFDRANQRLVHG